MEKENKKLEELTEREADWLQTDLRQTKQMVTIIEGRVVEAKREAERLQRDLDAMTGLALEQVVLKKKCEDFISGLYWGSRPLEKDREMYCADLADYKRAPAALDELAEWWCDPEVEAEDVSRLAAINLLRRAAEKAGDDIAFLEGDDDERPEDTPVKAEGLHCHPCTDPDCAPCAALADEWKELVKTRDALAGGVRIVADAMVAGRGVEGALNVGIEDLSRALITEAPAPRIAFLEILAEELRAMRNAELAAEDDYWDKKTGDDKEYPTIPEGLDATLKAQDIIKQVAKQLLEPLGGHICWEGEDGR
jgi:hypothetical protein